jgi:hypothetical protein
VTLTVTHASYAAIFCEPVRPLAIGFAPVWTQGGCTDELQIVFGTAEKLELSGECSN